MTSKISRSLRRAALGLLVTTAAAGAAAQAIGRDAQGEYVRGRIVVAPKAGLSDEQLSRVLAPHGGKARAIGRSGLYIVDLPANASETAIANLLTRHPLLKFAEVDRRFKPAFAPNDPWLPNEWHVTKIGATSAWDYAQGDGVTIAILDTGVDGTHPDLSAQMVPGWNFYDNNADASDVHGHGTGVAGAAAGTLNNGIGVAAVAGRAKIMPVRISDPTGWASSTTVAQALTWVADKGVRIASMSFSGMAGNSAVQTAAQYLKNKNGLLFVAAGNNAIDEGVPATSTMIPVSATDQNDALASFSSWGNFVALSAPGVYVASVLKGGGYSYWNGTSMATPVAAATAALVMSAKPSLSSTQVESILYSTAADLGSAGRDAKFGYGRVNASGAVLTALNTAAQTADTTAPTASITSPSGGSTVSGLVSVSVGASDNVGVTKVELRVNGSLVATDTASPYAFSWDTTKLSNGTANLSATAYDAAGNAATSATVAVNVSNVSTTITPPTTTDTTPPAVTITSPGSSVIAGSAVTVASSASDNAGAAGITQQLYIDGALKTTVTGSSLSFKWNTRKLSAGTHTLKVVARDAAGNASTATMSVTR